MWASHELLQAKELDTVNAQLIFGVINCYEVMLATAAFYVVPITQPRPRHTGCYLGRYSVTDGYR